MCNNYQLWQKVLRFLKTCSICIEILLCGDAVLTHKKCEHAHKNFRKFLKPAEAMLLFQISLVYHSVLASYCEVSCFSIKTTVSVLFVLSGVWHIKKMVTKKSLLSLSLGLNDKDGKTSELKNQVFTQHPFYALQT